MADEKTFTQKEVDDIVKGLKDKRTELLGKLEKFKGVDLDKLIETSKAYDELVTKQQEEEGNYKKLYEAANKKLESLTKDSESKVKELTEQLDQKDIRYEAMSQLSKMNVFPEMLDSALTLTTSGAMVTEEGIFVEGVALGEHLKAWTESDVGKRFVDNGNSGGDSNGSGKVSTTPFDKYFDRKSPEYNLTEQAKLANTDPTLHKKLVEKFTPAAN